MKTKSIDFVFRMSQNKVQYLKDQYEGLMHGEQGELTLAATTNTANAGAIGSIDVIKNKCDNIAGIIEDLDNDLLNFTGKK